jgi:arsenite methyltransferase
MPNRALVLVAAAVLEAREKPSTYSSRRPGRQVPTIVDQVVSFILDSDWGSLVWNCRDQALMDRAVALLTSPYADAHVPRTLSRRLVAAGFDIADRRTLTVLNWEPDPDSFSRLTAVGFIKSLMETSQDFTGEDWETWDADQRATAKAGEYMFSLNRYIFSALKP